MVALGDEPYVNPPRSRSLRGRVVVAIEEVRAGIVQKPFDAGLALWLRRALVAVAALSIATACYSSVDRERSKQSDRQVGAFPSLRESPYMPGKGLLPTGNVSSTFLCYGAAC